VIYITKLFRQFKCDAGHVIPS